MYKNEKNNHDRRPFILQIGIVAVILMSFVLGAGQTSHAAEKTVKIGYQPALCQPSIYVAIDKKMFERAGIKTKNLIFTAGPPMISAFKNREIDVGFLGAPPAISAMDKGINVSIYGWSHITALPSSSEKIRG